MPDRRRRKDPRRPGATSLPPEFGSLPDPAPRRPLADPSPPPTPPGSIPPPPDLSDDAPTSDLTPAPVPAPDEVIDLRAPDPADTEAAEPTAVGDGADDPPGVSAAGTAAPPATDPGVDQTGELPELGSGQGWAPTADVGPSTGGGTQTVGGPPRWGDGPRTGDIPPPPPPPVVVRRRRRIWPWFVWLGILMLPLVLIAGCTLMVFSLQPGPVDAANAFMAAVDEGRLEDAHSSLCPETRNNVSLTQFADDFSGAGGITGYQLVSMSIMSSPATVSGTVFIDSEPRAIRFEVAEVGDRWMVCLYEPIEQPPTG